VGEDNIVPKSVAREILERFCSFHDYVRDLGLQRFEGVLLRYLSEAFRALHRSVPVRFRNEAVEDLIGSLGGVVRTVDSSLLEEWEEMRAPVALTDAGRAAAEPKRPRDPAADPRAFAARVRAELHRLLGALARRDFGEALAAVREGEVEWTADRLAAEVAPYFDEHKQMVVTPAARSPRMTTLAEVAPRVWEAQQTIVDPEGDEDFAILVRVDLSEPLPPGQENAPLIELVRIGR
jgi:hypothetical protein